MTSISTSLGESGRLQKLGAALSYLCAVECTLLPLLLALVPFAPLRALENENVHLAVLSVSLMLGTWNLASGYRRHRRGAIFYWFIGALALIGTGLLIGDPTGEIFIAAGAILLGTAQVFNHQLCMACHPCRNARLNS